MSFMWGWWILSATVWDVWQEHMRKGDRSIDAPATRFGVIRGAPLMNNESSIGGSYFYRDKTMSDQHQNQVKWVFILIASETRVE